MIIHTHQINKDFIYFSQIADGVTEAGSFRVYMVQMLFLILKDISTGLNL